MARQSEIINAVGQTFLDCVREVTPVNGRHVGPLDPPSEHTKPYVGFSVARSSPNRGMGNPWNVIDRIRDDESNVIALEYQKRYHLHVWATAIVEELRSGIRDDIYDTIERTFDTLSQHAPTDLHADVDHIDVEGTENPQPSTTTQSQQLHLIVAYDAYRTYDDFEPAVRVNVDIDTVDPDSEASNVDRTFGPTN